MSKLVNKAIRLAQRSYDAPDFWKDSEKVAWSLEGNTLWIAFAGTDDFDDILEDLHISKKTINLGSKTVKVHSGFWNKWLQVRDRVLGVIHNTKPKYVRLTGHSAGGGNALCAFADLPYHLHPKYGVDTMSMAPIVFGAPKVFASSSIKALEGQMAARPYLLQNQGDPAPDTPRGYMGFAHWGWVEKLPLPWYQRIYLLRAFTGAHSLSTYKETVTKKDLSLR